MKNFPSSDNKIGTSKCSEYFNLFGALIKQYQEIVEAHPEEIEHALFSVKDLLKEACLRLRDHESTERDSDSSPDTVMIGMLILLKELLLCFTGQTQDYNELLEFVN